jgi:hypothetical protein
MRGALTDATLPVMMRRTCVCPSRLLAAAVNCLGICEKVKASPNCGSGLRKSGETSDRYRPGPGSNT